MAQPEGQDTPVTVGADNTQRRRVAAVAAGWIGALVVVAGASAGGEHSDTIEPSTRVKGMLVVQGVAARAQARLFGDWCDPVVLTSGRRVRNCGRVPRTARLYVGYGSFAPEKAIDRLWKTQTWEMWIDGQRVDLEAFGTTDRVLQKYPPANGKDVVLREWSMTLVRPTAGRHTIRYRTQEPGGMTDTTWIFTIAAG